MLNIVDVDHKIANVAYRKKTLPEFAQLDELNAKRLALAEQMVASQTELSDAQADLERTETDLEPARTRLDRNQKKIDSGLVESKVLQAMLDEIDHLKMRIDTLEDEQLEHMETVETLTARHETLAHDRREIEDQMRQLMVSRDAALAKLEAESADMIAARNTAASTIPADLMTLYDRIAAKLGEGAARLQGNRCAGCTLELNVIDMNAIKAASPDQVIRCSECGRILIRQNS